MQLINFDKKMILCSFMKYKQRYFIIFELLTKTLFLNLKKGNRVKIIHVH